MKICRKSAKRHENYKGSCITLNSLKFLLFIPFILLTLPACTTTGMHKNAYRKTIDFGREETLKVCFLREKDITDKNIEKILKKWNKELNLYNIKVENVSAETVERPGFFNSDILQSLFIIKLEPPCDRIVYLRGRRFSDMAYELFSIALMLELGLKFETYGAVETITNTRGFIRARYAQLFQSIFTSPKSTMVHEGYHLLGCGHSITKTKCYLHIKKLKERMASAVREEDFFPVLTQNGKLLSSRDEVNGRILGYIKKQNGKMSSDKK